MKIPVTIEVDLDELKNTVIDEATDLRIRRIVRDELREILPDITQAVRQDVIAYLTSELRKQTFSQNTIERNV